MRRIAPFLVVLLIAGGSPAQEKSRAATPSEAAARVRAAVEANDREALRALARRNAPDPWTVADFLCAQGRHDAALAFAKAAPRNDVEKLAAYVESRRGKSDIAAARNALAAVNRALGAKDGKGVLTALADVDTTAGDVVSVRLLHGRGFALRWLRRLPESSQAFAAAAAGAERLGWLSRAAASRHESGLSAAHRSDWRTALAAWERCLAVWESRGIPAGVAVALRNVGIIQQKLGAYGRALEYQERARELQRKLGDRKGEARTLGTIGNLHDRLGAHMKALACTEHALAFYEEHGPRVGVAASLQTIGIIHGHLGAYQTALEYLERTLALQREMLDRRGEAATLASIGTIHQNLGDYERALDYQQRAFERAEEFAHRAVMASALGNLGNVHMRRGAYAKALACQERALKLREELRDGAGVAVALGNIGILHQALGDHAKALVLQSRSLRLKERLGNGSSVAKALVNLGNIHQSLGNYAKALTHYERARALFDELGNRAELAATLGNIGVTHQHRADHEKALDSLERARALQEELGNRGAVAHAIAQIGGVHRSRGDHAKAVACYERSMTLAAETGSLATEVACLRGLARAQLALRNPAAAAQAARRAVLKLPTLIGQLAEEQGATARGRWDGLMDVGIHAALHLGDPTEVCFFLESGRAGTLLESLGNRDALGGVDIPSKLRVEDLATRATVLKAQAQHARALESGKRREIRAARTALDAARGKMLEVVARIQRAAKAAADVAYPKAAPLEEIQRGLAPDEALVLYALGSKNTVALVVTGKGARIVTLGETAKIEAALQRLSLHDRANDQSTPLASLHRIVIEPLGLAPATKRILISPHGPLAYVPFAILFPGRAVAYVPSGTTLGVLRDERAKRGRSVLALADPVYKTLPRLRATGEEAKAVGDVVLVREDANETGFRRTLQERERWRAVHLACHGLVDTARPLLSSLALTPAGGEDGFLTTMEIFRMKIHADLVVLSACETGKGKLYRTEGIIGFTRAFMFAGTPRVIVSLWKVDDEATRALMVKFYELWRTHPTATALKRAQEFVRGHEKWKHPHYWAAWQLWGLPD